MYLVLSALTSSPISVIAATKASAFSFRICILPPRYIIIININQKLILLNVSEFKYLGKTLMNQDCIREEIKTTLNLGNVTARSCIFCLPDCFKKNMAIHRYKNVILPVVLCRCQTWSLTLREEQGIRLFRNRMLNEILGLKWRNVKSHIELYDLYSLLNIIEEIKSRSLR